MKSPRPVPALTDDLLGEIFLRIGAPADLARASTACVSFHRLIADPSFLRRYRSLHPPLLLGLLGPVGRGFQPAEAPHPSAALARAADFSFENYLPRVAGARWYLSEVRDGRVLFRCFPEDDDEEETLDLAVCDPLARRCLLLPPIPDDLLASIRLRKHDIIKSEVSLVPSGYGEDDTSFRVIAIADFKEMVATFIFSSVAFHWSAGASASWDALGIPLEDHGVVSCGYPAYGCCYWKAICKNKWLKFDMSSMEFAAVDLPPGRDGNYVVIGEAGEGRLGMYSLIDNNTFLCCNIVRQIEGGGFDRVIIDKIIPLPVGYHYHIHGPYEGRIFMSGSQPKDVAGTCFTLEIKTLKIERVCQMVFRIVTPYFGFPPSMSQRRI